jgi:hypothetical protein
MRFLKDRWISSDAIVTIYLADGVHSYSSAVILDHPCGNRIQIVGQNTYTFAITGVYGTPARWSDSNGYDVVIVVDNASNIVVGDYLYVGYNRGCTGGTNPDFLAGCHLVTTVDTVNKRVTCKVYNKQALPPSGAVTCSGCVVLKTKVTFAGCNGFDFRSPSSVTLGKLVIVSTTSSTTAIGVVVQSVVGATCRLLAPVGIVGGFNTGISLTLGCRGIAPGLMVSGATTYGVYCAYGAYLEAAYMVVNGVPAPVYVTNSAGVDCPYSVVFGCSLHAVWSRYSSSIAMASSRVLGTTGACIYADFGASVDANWSYLAALGTNRCGIWVIGANVLCDYATIANCDPAILSEASGFVGASTCTFTNNNLVAVARNNGFINRANPTLNGNTNTYSPSLNTEGNYGGWIV